MVPMFELSEMIERTLMSMTPCGHASRIGKLSISTMPGTFRTVSALTVPSFNAALTLKTFATDPGSYASTAAKLPVAITTEPAESRRTLDIA